jgi:hypothetical protein
MMENSEILSTIPPDTIKFDGEFFSGSACVLEPDKITIREITFTLKQPHELKPFKYNKPIPNKENPFENERFELDEDERVGVRPIALVRKALRKPNHLYETDDALLCAFQNPQSGSWETRYFPKKSLNSEVWQQAMDLLNVPANDHARH